MNLPERNSFTLTELLVATVIVGIIMIGITGIDIALRSSQLGTTRTGLVAMRTAAIMLHMTKNISLAKGYGDLPNDSPGFVFTAGNTLPMWVRIGDNSNSDPTDDTWVCYDMPGNDVRYCPISENGCPANCNTCNNPTGPVENLGPVASVTVNHLRNDIPPNQEFAVEVTIVNRFDPTQPRDINKNPEYTLTTQIETPMQSF